MKRVALMLAISALMLVGVAGPSFATDRPDTPNPNADCFSDCPVTPPVIPDPPEPETPVVPDSPYVPEEWNPPVVEDGPRRRTSRRWWPTPRQRRHRLP